MYKRKASQNQRIFRMKLYVFESSKPRYLWKSFSKSRVALVVFKYLEWRKLNYEAPLKLKLVSIWTTLQNFMSCYNHKQIIVFQFFLAQVMSWNRFKKIIMLYFGRISSSENFVFFFEKWKYLNVQFWTITNIIITYIWYLTKIINDKNYSNVD